MDVGVWAGVAWSEAQLRGCCCDVTGYGDVLRWRDKPVHLLFLLKEYPTRPAPITITITIAITITC
jgi:hypothetical protein